MIQLKISSALEDVANNLVELLPVVAQGKSDILNVSIVRLRTISSILKRGEFNLGKSMDFIFPMQMCSPIPCEPVTDEFVVKQIKGNIDSLNKYLNEAQNRHIEVQISDNESDFYTVKSIKKNLV